MNPIRPRPRPGVLLLALGVLAAACTSSEPAPRPATRGGEGQLVAEVASSDLSAGSPQRLLVGLFAVDGRFVSFGTVDFSFSYLGTAEAPSEPRPGPQATASFVPTPGTPDGGGAAPTLTLASEGRGVYQADDLTFDEAGIWQVTVSADVEGLGGGKAASAFEVLEEPRLPAPGQQALATENLTIHSKDAPVGAIDSRAVESGRIPDTELHEWTIARALAEGRPALVVFSTPTFCVSRFCGPVTDVVSGLAKEYRDRAVFIHVEIWRDYREKTINQAAADWLLRDGDLTEPWLFLIGADARIADRWGALFDPDEVAAALENLPAMS